MNVRSGRIALVGFTVFGLLLAACSVSVQTQGEDGGDGALETQVAQIATDQSRLATQVGRLGDSIQQLDAANANQDEIISYLLTRMPLPQALPERALTITPTPYLPIGGAVLIEEGACCAGGIVGEVLQVRVSFEAHSSFGPVVDMRVVTSGALDTQALADSPWEPYRPQAVYPVEIFTANWVGWWVVVQYRDEAGNVSPIYYDDISIEGMPAPPTSTP